MILSNIKLLHDIKIDQKFCLYLDLNFEPIFRLFPKNYNSKARCYTTFYVRNLLIFVTS